MAVATATRGAECTCSKESYSPSELAPLPHLASITYFRSPRKIPHSLPQARPVHPTPRKMAAMADPNTVPTVIHHQHRPSSVSAIPRPASGSSRRATPLGVKIPSATALDAEATVKPRHNRHRSGLPISSNPPSSFNIQRANPLRPDSQLPYSQRPASRELSGTRQQLHLRNFSTQSFTGPDPLSSTKLSSTSLPSTILRGLPKSKTSISLAQKVKDITPQHRLLQPLGPPTPKFHTSGSLSCFTGVGVGGPTPSPKKDGPPADDGASAHSKVGVVDALLESRMTEEEVSILKQVGKEASANKRRLRSSSGEYWSAFESQPDTLSHSDKRGSDPTLVLKLSVNDVANSRRLEEQRLRTNKKNNAKRRTLFINSTLANAWAKEPALPTPDSSPGHPSTHDNWEVNLKDVHFEESISYWTGRFMALSDRLKTNDTPHVSSNFKQDRKCLAPRDSDEPFANAEYRRTNAALAELRSCCRTEKATKSFGAFEKQLKINLLKRMEPPVRHGKEIPLVEAVQQHSAKPRPKQLPLLPKPKSPWWLGSVSGAGSAVSSRVASIGTTNSANGVSVHNGFVPRPTLAKSKTTGNLAKFDRHFTDGGNDPPEADVIFGPSWTMLKSDWERKSSYQQGNALTLLKTMREREERAQRRAAEARRRINGRGVPVEFVSADKKADWDVADGFGRNLKSLGEAGVNAKAGAGQTARNSSARQISGEMLKGFLDSGIKGVRRMGRRVTGGALEEDRWDGRGVGE